MFPQLVMGHESVPVTDLFFQRVAAPMAGRAGGAPKAVAARVRRRFVISMRPW